jgi:hypothetical protein
MTTPIARLMRRLNVNDVEMANKSSKLLRFCMGIQARMSFWFTNFRWNHFENAAMGKIEDLLLRQETGGDCVSAVFQYISH